MGIIIIIIMLAPTVSKMEKWSSRCHNSPTGPNGSLRSLLALVESTTDVVPKAANPACQHQRLSWSRGLQEKSH